jgi:hypothetical protein
MTKNVAYYSESAPIKFMNCIHFTLLPKKKDKKIDKAFQGAYGKS